MGLLFVILIIILAIIGVVAPVASSIMTALSIIMWVLIVIEAAVAIFFVYGMIKETYYAVLFSILSSISSGVAIAFTASIFIAINKELDPDSLGDMIGFAFFLVPLVLSWLGGVCYLWGKTNISIMDDEGFWWLYFLGELLISVPLIAFVITHII